MKLGFYIALLPVYLSLSGIEHLVFAKPPQSSACEVVLPDQIREQLKREYQGWTILNRDNLNAHQLEIWGNRCPGVASANFKGRDILSYAAVMIRGQMGRNEAIMLLIQDKGSGYDIQKLREEKDIPSYPVVHSEPPGKYREFYDRQSTIQAEFEVFVYEYLEATATLFYYKGGQVRHILISD